jgi:hypothetical protein
MLGFVGGGRRDGFKANPNFVLIYGWSHINTKFYVLKLEKISNIGRTLTFCVISCEVQGAGASLFNLTLCSNKAFL